MNEERLIEQRWAQVGPRVMDKRLDALRNRADFLSHMLNIGRTKHRARDEQEHAALMWAIAELTGIGEEVRRDRLEREQVTAAMCRKAKARADAAEALNTQFRSTIAGLKHDLWLLRRSESGATAAAVDPHVGGNSDCPRATEALSDVALPEPR